MTSVLVIHAGNQSSLVSAQKEILANLMSVSHLNKSYSTMKALNNTMYHTLDKIIILKHTVHQVNWDDTLLRLITRKASCGQNSNLLTVSREPRTLEFPNRGLCYLLSSEVEHGEVYDTYIQTKMGSTRFFRKQQLIAVLTH